MARKKKLQGQVAIVTGGSRGIGLAVAQQFAQVGAAVVLVARSEDAVVEAAEQLRRSGAQALGVVADVSDYEQVDDVTAQALDRFQRVDILVNNAGVVWPIDELGEVDPDEWAYNIHVNLIGPFYFAHSVLPTMVAQRYGRIINVSSGLSSTPYAGLSAYSAAKAGLDQMTRILALELKGKGVSVNALYPGMVNTDMQADIRSVDTSESSLDLSMFHARHDAGEMVTPQQAANLVYWLAGSWSAGRSGEIFSFRDEAWLAQVNKDLEIGK